MNVSILSHTPNADRLVAACARGDYLDRSLVGTDLDDDEEFAELMDGASTDSLEELLERLMKRRHFGPWEHAHVTFAVEGISRTCMAQLSRHRIGISLDVQSQRYCSFSDASVARPPSITDDEVVSREGGVTELEEGREEAFDEAVEAALESYNELLDKGVPKEDARFVLPEGTLVNLSMTVNLRTLMHIANLRAKANAQWEIRDFTKQLLDEAETVAPITMRLWDEVTPLEVGP